MIYLIYIGILSIGGNKGSPFLHKDLAVFYPVSTFTCAKTHHNGTSLTGKPSRKKCNRNSGQESCSVDYCILDLFSSMH